jgi:hypothetical protein
MRLLDVQFNSPGELRVVFGFSNPHAANVALTINLDDEGNDQGKVFDEIMKIVEVVRFCQNYEHCSECGWRQFTAIVNRCRESVPVACRSTALTVKIRDQIIEDLSGEGPFMERKGLRLETGLYSERSQERVFLLH